MKKQNRIIGSILLVVGLIAATSILYFWRVQNADGNLGYRDSEFQEVANGQSEVKTTETEVPKKNIVAKVVDKVAQKVEEINDEYFAQANVSYDVPFTSQAPYANWNPPYDEACEESSMLMVDAYFKGYPLTPASADKGILDQVAWQTQKGYPIDINAEQVQEVLAAYFQLESEVVYEPTVEDIQKTLDEGGLVIVPAAGRLLGNPYFTPPGPIYHMFVVTGYDNNQKEFITNDPGTRRGEGYRYSYDGLMNAIHDWNGGDVYNGKKVIVKVPKQ